MALYAIGDLHLSLGVDKPMDIFGGAWDGYEQKLRQNLTQTLQEGDTLVIAGDMSWGINLREALQDFRFLAQLPCQVLLVKGNHDLWWETASKMNRFLEENELKNIAFLHNNCHMMGKTALCGTRGWFDDGTTPHSAKMVNREVQRLKLSLEAAAAAGAERIICFIHYPPKTRTAVCEPILELLEQYPVEACYYGHLHGPSIRQAFENVHNGVKYRLISADSVNFQPILIELQKTVE